MMMDDDKRDICHLVYMTYLTYIATIHSHTLAQCRN